MDTSLTDVVATVPRTVLSDDSAPLLDALRKHGLVVIELPASDGHVVSTTLRDIGAILEPLHGSTPRLRTQQRVMTSSWTRRILFNFLPDDPHQYEDEEHPKLTAAAEAAAAAQPVLLRITRVATDAIPVLNGRVLTNGKFDAFFYPSDDDEASGVYTGEDRCCPCPEHVDPGVVTLVAELGCAAIEARDAASGSWQRVCLQPNEVCLLVGQTLSTLTDGAFPACLHRVAPTAADRASYVFEVHLRVEEDVLSGVVPTRTAGAQKATTVAGDVVVDVRNFAGRRRLGARLWAWMRRRRAPRTPADRDG